MTHKLIADAERIAGLSPQESPTAEALLKLAAKLQEARDAAPKLEAGLFDVARERVLGHLLATRLELVRLSRAQEGPHLLLVKPPSGRKAPVQLVALDRLPPPLRVAVLARLGAGDPAEDDAAWSIPGLALRRPDPTLASLFDGLDAAACLRVAEEAEEAFDYERALCGLRVAVARAEPRLPAVRRLVRHLAEVTCDHAEVAELLSSPSLQPTLDRELQRALADALAETGALERARAVYERLAKSEPTADLLSRAGEMALRQQDLAAARAHLQAALRLDPAHDAARAQLERLAATDKDAVECRVAEARAALERRDFTAARALLEALAKGKPQPAVERLRQDLDRAELRARAAELVAEAQRRVAAEDWLPAQKALRDALRLAPGEREAHAALVARVDAAVARQQSAQQLDAARRHEAQGDLDAALEAYLHALEAGATGLEGRLAARLERYVQRAGGLTKARPTDRTLAGLAALHRAEEHLGGQQQDKAAAEAAVREARKHLKDDPDVRALEAQLQAQRETERLGRALRFLAESEAHEATNALDLALAALERAVEAAGKDVVDTAERRKRLKAALTAQRTDAEQAARFEGWLAAGNPFAVLRATQAETHPSPARERAVAMVSDRFRVDALPPPMERTPGVLALERAGFPADRLDDVLIAVDEGGDTTRLWIGAGERLLWVESPELRVRATLRLPAPLRISRRTTRLFPTPQGVLLFDAEARVLWTLEWAGTRLGIVNRFELERLPPMDPVQLATDAVVDPGLGRLLIAVSERGGQAGRLLSLDLADGQVKGEESFNHGVFNLRHVHGEPGAFTVQRALDTHRITGRLFFYGLCDARGKVGKRLFFPDLEAPMHAIRRIVHVHGPSAPAAPIFCQYWFLNPFSGEVVKEPNAFLQLKPGHEVFFQTSNPDAWLGDDKVGNGSFAVHEGEGLLLFPWRGGRKGKDLGVTGVTWDRFQRKLEVPVPEGQALQRLFEDRKAQRVFGLLRSATGLALRELDVKGRAFTG